MAIRGTSHGEWSVPSILVSMVVILLVVAAGQFILLPGLEPAFVDYLMTSGGSSQASILALGVGPVLQAFALGQLLVLALPKLEGHRAVVIAIRIIVLLMALSQAYGITQGLAESSQPLLDDDFPQWVVVASLVGGAAVTLFLSERLHLPLLGLGLWLVWLFPGLASIPNEVASIFEMLRFGASGLTQPLIVLGYCVGGLSICILAGRLLVEDAARPQNSGSGPLERRDLLSIIVWPPILAAVSASYILIPLALLMPDFIGSAEWLRSFIMAMTAVLIPVFLWLYRRRFAQKGFVIRAVVIAILAVVEVVVVAGGMLLAQSIMMPLILNGTMILVISAIWFAVMDVAKSRRAQAAPA